MKTNLFLTLLMVFGLAVSANAGNEGAQAVPVQPPTVLAEYVHNGGFFVPPGAISSYSYQILTDGTQQVLAFKMWDDSSQARVLGKLCAEELSALKASVEAILPGEMFDPNPVNPGCMDAPSSYSRVYQAAGPIVIAERMNCKDMQRPNSGQADQAVLQALGKVVQLANKAQEQDVQSAQ